MRMFVQWLYQTDVQEKYSKTSIIWNERDRKNSFELSVVHMIKNWWFVDMFGWLYFTRLYNQIVQL